MKQYEKAVYYDWEELDPKILKWLHTYFGSHVEGEGERDETDWGILIDGHTDSDKEKFFAIFEKYDTEGDYEAETEWDTTGAIVLPMSISNRVFSEFSEIGFVANRALATYDGVLFLPHAMS